MAEEAEVAFAQVEPAALQTSLVSKLRFISQFLQDRLVGIGPDLFERFLGDIAEGVIAPELVGVNGAIPANAADFFADAIAGIGEEQSSCVLRSAYCVF